MKGDFTRRTFRPRKQYNSVRMQQGRVQLDADWNEQVEIQQSLGRTARTHAFSPTGVPAETAGAFRIDPSETNLSIGSGYMYVDGILCECGSEVFYNSQPDFPVELTAAEKSAP